MECISTSHGKSSIRRCYDYNHDSSSQSSKTRPQVKTVSKLVKRSITDENNYFNNDKFEQNNLLENNVQWTLRNVGVPQASNHHINKRQIKFFYSKEERYDDEEKRVIALFNLSRYCTSSAGIDLIHTYCSKTYTNNNWYIYLMCCWYSTMI